MKKNQIFGRTLSAVLCGILLACPFQVSAEESSYVYENPQPVAVKTDLFDYYAESSYRPLTLNDSGFPAASRYDDLRSDATEANFMVTAVYYSGVSGQKLYTFVRMNFDRNVETFDSTGLRGYTEARYLEEFGSEFGDLHPGDLLYMHTNCIESYPVLFRPELDDEYNFVKYVGNAMDIFGEEFADVLRHEMILSRYYAVDAVNPKRSYEVPDYVVEAIGDVTNDGNVSVVDVLSLNRSLLGLDVLDDYAALAADVNKDGTADATDSLNILKHVVGLIDDFDSLAN